MSDKIEIKWQGPGWYSGRYDENGNIIVEKVAETEAARITAKAIAGGLDVNWYADPPVYMEVESEPEETELWHCPICNSLQEGKKVHCDNCGQWFDAAGNPERPPF